MKKLKFIIVFLFSAFVLNAQVFREFNTGFRTIFLNPIELTSYYFGYNPALLDFTSDEELLILSANAGIDEGKFKRFIEPESNQVYQFTASGKKVVDDFQRFKGSFGIQRFERKDWPWVFTRDYLTGNPFLIGDSTVGNSRINGIMMNAEYSNKIFEDLALGLAVDYSVDEMLKQISPRPTSKHRDIHSRLGLNYSLNSAVNFGVIADIADRSEEISYREDEGAITKETIILKFKGYDFPNVFRKKTETRYSYSNGYAGGITFSYNIADGILSAGYLISGFDKTTIKDDAINPKTEGFWLNDYLDAGLQIFIPLSDQIQTGLIYKYHKDDGWAKYPSYDVLYYEKVLSTHSVTAGIKSSLSDNISFGVEAGLNLTTNDEHDHYSAIKSKVNSNIYFGRLGLGAEWTNDFSSIISYAFSKKAIPDYSATLNEHTDYFTNYRKYDIAYLYTESVKHEITLVSKIDPWFGGSIYTYLNYFHMIPESGSIFASQIKNEFNFTLEYRVKVF